MKKKSVGSKIASAVIYIVLIGACLICILPFVHLLAVSFSSSAAATAGKVGFWPVDFTTIAYEFAFKGGKFMEALGRSIWLVILGTSVNLLMMIITAYPLSREKDQLLGRNIYMTFFVITMLIGGGLIPTYLTVVKAGLKNSIWSLILPGALPVYNTVILMNFIRGLPRELEEAARIDGATELQVLYKILLPLLKPSLATVGLFCIVGHWNNWFGPVIYIKNTADYPLASYLRTLLVNMEDLMKKSSDYSLIISQMNAQTGRAAQLFMGAVPMLIAYPFLQKYFTAGLTIGSVKG